MAILLDPLLTVLVNLFQLSPWPINTVTASQRRRLTWTTFRPTTTLDLRPRWTSGCRRAARPERRE